MARACLARARYHAAMTRAPLAMLLAGVALAVVTAAAAQVPAPPQPPSAADPFPEAPGKADLVKVCSNCHSAETVIQTLRLRQEWSEVIDQMARFGADATDKEFDRILAYLSAHFSPIKVNTAAPKDLAGLLDVPPEVAEAMVAYRAANGAFKTADDLKKVPGLDSDKVEALKSRIVF